MNQKLFKYHFNLILFLVFSICSKFTNVKSKGKVFVRQRYMAGAVRPLVPLPALVSENDVDFYRRQHRFTNLRMKRSCSKLKNIALVISRLFVMHIPVSIHRPSLLQKWAVCDVSSHYRSHHFAGGD